MSTTHKTKPPFHVPERCPSDHPHVAALLDESERITALGNKWNAKHKGNPVAAGACFSLGWAHAVSAAWLRCKLKGEVK